MTIVHPYKMVALQQIRPDLRNPRTHSAERTGRRCFTMELQPVYVDVIVRRWQDFTGQAAHLEDDGRAFDELAAERTDADTTV